MSEEYHGNERRQYPSSCHAEVHDKISKVEIEIIKLSSSISSLIKELDLKHGSNLEKFDELKRILEKSNRVIFGDNGGIGLVGYVDNLKNDFDSRTLWFRVMSSGLLLIILKELWFVIAK